MTGGLGWQRQLAMSKAGHDKGRYYVIVKEEKTCVQVADGSFRTLEHPKRKNKKHIQAIKNLPIEVVTLLQVDQGFGNEAIKRAIKLYLASSLKEAAADKDVLD
jgi:ribosomal protein L14E/L6E/L27E